MMHTLFNWLNSRERVHDDPLCGLGPREIADLPAWHEPAGRDID